MTILVKNPTTQLPPLLSTNVTILWSPERLTQRSSNSLFMCQDEDENQSFGSFWNLCMKNEPIIQCIIVLRAWFVRHRLYPERTKTFVFGFIFVFVLAHEQPINTQNLGFREKTHTEKGMVRALN